MAASHCRNANDIKDARPVDETGAASDPITPDRTSKTKLRNRMMSMGGR
jgi:hypothetical protein